MQFKERFNEVLKNSEITQTELAKRIGISKQCISDFKSGKSLPSINTLFILCKVLDISSDFLLGLSNNY